MNCAMRKWETRSSDAQSGEHRIVGKGAKRKDGAEVGQRSDFSLQELAARGCFRPRSVCFAAARSGRRW